MTPIIEVQDVERLTRLLDVMENFANNEQRARFILTSNWIRDRGMDAQINAIALYERAMEESKRDVETTFADDWSIVPTMD